MCQRRALAGKAAPFRVFGMPYRTHRHSVINRMHKRASLQPFLMRGALI